MEFLFVPSILFLVIVAPVWITSHYRYKNKMAKGISEGELAEIEVMLETIDTLAERVENLEELLSEEHPEWRKTQRRARR